MHKFIQSCPSVRPATNNPCVSSYRYKAVAFGVGGSVSTYDPSQKQRGGTWAFRIELHREIEQVPISEVLRHPTAFERDDYEEYLRIRENNKGLRVQQQVELEETLEAEDHDTKEKVRSGEWVAVQGGVIVPRGEVSEYERLPNSEAMRLRMGRLRVSDDGGRRKKTKSAQAGEASEASSGRLSPGSRRPRSEGIAPLDDDGQRPGLLARSPALIELPSPGLRPTRRRTRSGWTPGGGSSPMGASTPMERAEGAPGPEKGKWKEKDKFGEGWIWA